MTAGGGGGLNVYTSVPLFRQLAIPLCCFSVTIQIFSPLPVCLLEVFRLIFCASCFLLPSRWSSYPGSGMTPHRLSPVVSWYGWGRQTAENVPALAC
jgi:hypothetical protein